MACGDKAPSLMADHPAAKGLASLRRGDAAGALTHFEELVRQEPGGVPGHFLRAEAIERLGNRERARSTLNDLAVRFPFAEGACRERLAVLYLRDGDAGSALEALRRAAELGWSNVEAVTRDPAFGAVAADPAFREVLDRARQNAAD